MSFSLRIELPALPESEIDRIVAGAVDAPFFDRRPDSVRGGGMARQVGKVVEASREGSDLVLGIEVETRLVVDWDPFHGEVRGVSFADPPPFLRVVD